MLARFTLSNNNTAREHLFARHLSLFAPRVECVQRGAIICAVGHAPTPHPQNRTALRGPVVPLELCKNSRSHIYSGRKGDEDERGAEW